MLARDATVRLDTNKVLTSRDSCILKQLLIKRQGRLAGVDLAAGSDLCCTRCILMSESL